MGIQCQACVHIAHTKNMKNATPLIHRLNRAEGQIRALRAMLQTEQPTNCKDFLSQVKAVRSALRRVSEQYVLEHLHHCETLPKEERDARLAEALSALAND